MLVAIEASFPQVALELADSTKWCSKRVPLPRSWRSRKLVAASPSFSQREWVSSTLVPRSSAVKRIGDRRWRVQKALENHPPCRVGKRGHNSFVSHRLR
jgi:hypothetical protein